MKPTMGVKPLAMILFAGTLLAEDSRVCAACHRQIWESYQRTGMGRSFSLASFSLPSFSLPSSRPLPDRLVEDVTGKSVFYHEPSASYFTMLTREGRVVQRRHQLDAAGKAINILEMAVDYIMGSGNHARAYLHRTAANTLIQLPLGWYAEKGGYYAMNPGYDRADHDGFRRPITYDCMFCHNAYPKIPGGYEKPFAESVYEGPLPEGIDCARCHGPGARHTQLAGQRTSMPAQIRAAIVNPKRMPPDRQLELCMSCHLETTSFPLPNAIQRYDRGPFSFRPGEALANFLLNFDHAPGSGRGEKFEIVNAGYRMRQSPCFVKSGVAKLTCTTCHNPHDAPRGEAAIRHYDAACRQCHAAPTQHDDQQRDCASCHMPKRRTEDVIHVVATDHLIQRRKPAGKLLAERSEHRAEYRGSVALYYPVTLPPSPESELYLAVAQVKQKSNLKSGIAQLSAAIRRHAPARAEWYLELAEALDADGQLAKSVAMYREAARRDPGSYVAIQRLGTVLRRSGQLAESVAVLRRSLALAPARALTWHELALTYRAQGRTADAATAIETASRHDPGMPEVQNNLGILRAAAGDLARAESALREAIRIQPNYADAHGNLANVLVSLGRLSEARTEFEQALRLRPTDAPVRYNYAMLLGRTGRYDEAQRELEACLRTESGFASAHELLGDLRMARGETRRAIESYREVVRLEPGSGRGHLALGTALAGVGDRNAAIPHLRRAAQDRDAELRRRAMELLRKLN